MRWVSYTRSISSRIGEENPANTIAEQNANIEQYLKNKGYRISEKYSDRKRSAEAADGFDRMVQDGMTQKFDAVAVDSIFRFGKTLPFAIEVLQKTFYPVGIQFAVVEDDFCSTDRTADEVEQYFKEKVIEKIRFEFMASRQDSFEKGVLTHRQAKYGYDISEDRRSFVLDSESAYIVKLIFQMYLEGMTLQEIGAALDAQNVPSPQIQMTRNKKVTRKTKWPVTTIRSILVNPLYIGKLTLKLSGAEKKMEAPPIVSEEDFQKVQERINDSVKLPAPKRRSTPNILIKKIYDRASGERLLCRTTEDETRQIYSFDRKCKCFSGKAPYIESTEVFDVIRFSLKKAQEQARYIGRLLESDKDEVKRCQNIVLNPYREQARTLTNWQWLRGYYIVGHSEFGCSIFSKITAAEKEGKTEFPFTMGQNQFDFIDYDDFCAQVAAAVGQDEINGIINICSGKPEKLADRVERFIKENGYGIKLKYGAFPDRPYDSKAVWGDNKKITQIMNEKKYKA